jgi:hypothetical protein
VLSIFGRAHDSTKKVSLPSIGHLKINYRISRIFIVLLARE